MGRTFQPADGICRSIWGGAGSWGFGTVWHKPDDTAVAAIAVLGGIQHRHLWPWQLCRVFGPADLPASNSGPARHSNPDGRFGNHCIFVYF